MEPACSEKAFAVLAFGLIDAQDFYDPVTGLPGTALLIDRVPHELLARTARKASPRVRAAA